jgi:spore coat polysaccharide biosynthesis protein SpsF (cytidylyltransferase family)
MSGRFGCVAGIQARNELHALAGQVLADLGGAPLIQRVYERTRAAALVDEVFVLTSNDASDDGLADMPRGAASRSGAARSWDVRSRFLDLAEETRAQFVVRVTGDCPFVAPEFIDLRLGALRALNVDFVDVDDDDGTLAGTLGGQDAFSARALRLSLASGDARDAEHVASFFFTRRDGLPATRGDRGRRALPRPGCACRSTSRPTSSSRAASGRACDLRGRRALPARARAALDRRAPEVRALNRTCARAPTTARCARLRAGERRRRQA